MQLGSAFSSARRAGLLGLACALSASSFLCYACDDGKKPESAGGMALDGSGGAPAADVAVSPADGSALTSTVRFVHLAANMGSVNFCLRGKDDETFTGPVLGAGGGADGGSDAGASSADSGDGQASPSDSGGAETGTESDADATNSGPPQQADAALAPRTMTNYLSFAGSGTFDVAVVAAGQKSCAAPFATLKVTVDPSKLTTIVLTGDHAMGDGGAGDAGGGGLRLFRVLDDPSLDPKQARIRIVNAAYGASLAGGAQDLRVDTLGSQKTTIAADVPLGAATNQSMAAPVTDALGYTLTAPQPPSNALSITGSVDASSGGAWTSAYTNLGLTAASLHTGFIVSDATESLAVVWCSDTSTIGKRVDCRVLGQPAGDL